MRELSAEIQQEPPGIPIPVPRGGAGPGEDPIGTGPAGLGASAGYPETSREREAPVTEFLPLVRAIAHRLAIRLPPLMDVQDLIGAGTIGLLEALRDYDPLRKNKFQTYAFIRIRGAMLDAMRDQGRVPRSFRDRYKRFVHAVQTLADRFGREPETHEIRTELGMSEKAYEEFLERARPLSFLSLEEINLAWLCERPTLADGLASREPTPQESVELQEVRAMLAGAIDRLPQREKQVVQLYYYEHLNLKEIGRVLEVSESRVSQLHTQAILRLKGILEKVQR